MCELMTEQSLSSQFLRLLALGAVLLVIISIVAPTRPIRKIAIAILTLNKENVIF